jgi:hypothetical protein
MLKRAFLPWFVTFWSLGIEEDAEESLLVDENTAGKTLRKRERIEGMQAQIIPTGTSMVLQTPRST